MDSALTVDVFTYGPGDRWHWSLLDEDGNEVDGDHGYASRAAAEQAGREALGKREGGEAE